MKKKILLSIFSIFVFCICLIQVNAATDPLFSVGWNLQAESPKLKSDNTLNLPANDLTYGTVTTGFDFSKVVFSDNTGADLNGKTNLEKIIIGELQKSNIANNNSAKKQSGETDKAYVTRLLKNYFTGYCLDEAKKYPSMGLFTAKGAKGYSQAVNSDGTFNSSADMGGLQVSIILASIVNDNNSFSHIFNRLNALFGDDLSDVMMVYPDTDVLVSLDPDKSIEELYADFMNNASTKVNMGFSYIGFDSFSADKQVFFVSNDAFKEDIRNTYGNDVIIEYITGSNYHNPNYESDDSLGDFYPLNVSLSDLAFQKYAKSDATTDYNHALWIVENSYPTLDLDVALSKAGVDKTTYQNQIKGLYSINDSQLAEYTEMVTFGIVQYSVWKVTGNSVEGHQIGNSIKNASELNKLFTYLIDTNNVPENYHRSLPYSKSISFTQPEENKELFKHDGTNNKDYYGPYSANYTALVEQGEKIQFTIDDGGKNAVELVDASFNKVTSLNNGQQFYISVKSDVEVKDINIDFNLNNIVIFEPNENRGKIYSPVTSMSQNVLVGGRTRNVSITGALDLTIGNPNTGVQNVALLLMVTLVSFTLGYLVLTYKQKPINLQQ